MANTHETLGSLFSSIASSIRAKTGSTEAIVADEFPAKIAAIDTQEDLSEEMTAQDALIAQIATALEGKAVGGGSDFVEVTLNRAGGGTIKYYDESRVLQTISTRSEITTKVFRGIVYVYNSMTPAATGDFLTLLNGDLGHVNNFVFIFKTDGGSVFSDD